MCLYLKLASTCYYNVFKSELCFVTDRNFLQVCVFGSLTLAGKTNKQTRYVIEIMQQVQANQQFGFSKGWVMESSTFHGCVSVRFVGKHDVHVVQLQPL